MLYKLLTQLCSLLHRYDVLILNPGQTTEMYHYRCVNKNVTLTYNTVISSWYTNLDKQRMHSLRIPESKKKLVVKIIL